MNISPKLKFIFQIGKTHAFLARRFSSQGLGFGDMAVLYSISQAPNQKIRRVDLAEAVGLTASGVTRILVPLEKIGVVKREANARDARVSFVALTESGKELLKNSIKSAEIICDDLISKEQAKKLEQIYEIIEKMK